jgi:hypothetical protein
MQRAARPVLMPLRRVLRTEVETYVEGQIANLPGRLEDLLAQAGTKTLAADAVAVNRAIIVHAPQDIPAHNRLGRAYQPDRACSCRV